MSACTGLQPLSFSQINPFLVIKHVVDINIQLKTGTFCNVMPVDDPCKYSNSSRMWVTISVSIKPLSFPVTLALPYF